MEIINLSQAKANLSKIFDRVCDDHAPVVVTRRNDKHVVIMSLEDYQSVSQTLCMIKKSTNQLP